MHPPEAQFRETAPCVEYMYHVETAQANQQCSEARLRREAAFDATEKFRSFGCRTHLRHGGNQYRVTIATPPIHNTTPSTWSTLANANSSIKVAPDVDPNFIARIYCPYLLPYAFLHQTPARPGNSISKTTAERLLSSHRGAPHFPWNHVLQRGNFLEPVKYSLTLANRSIRLPVSCQVNTYSSTFDQIGL